MVEPDEQMTILDVGCGTGSSMTIYAGIGRHYFGLDLSLTSLHRARLKNRSGKWLRGDALRLPFGDCSFDVVAFSSVLHHLTDQIVPLREAFRVLRPGGIAFAFDPNLLNVPMAVLRHPKSPLYVSAGVSPDERPLAPSALRRSFEQAGFLTVRQRAQSGIEFRSTAVGFVNVLLPLYNAVGGLIDRLGAGRWCGPFVLTTGLKADG